MNSFTTTMDVYYAGMVAMLNTRKGKVEVDSKCKFRLWHPDEKFQPKQAVMAWVKAEGHMKVRNAL